MYKLITVEGTDAGTFLQGQLTQDVSAARSGAGLPAAWCSPRGRVIVTIFIVPVAAGFELLVPADIAAEIVDRLLKFRFRAAVDIKVVDCDWRRMVLKQGFFSADAKPSALPDDPDDLTEESWRSILIAAGVPVIEKNNSEKFTPHMLNLDKLGAISFTKGCYTGQEVVARTEHLGKSKRRLTRYQVAKQTVTVGDKLQDGDKNVGEVVNVAGSGILAVVPVTLHEKALLLGGIEVMPVKLTY